MIRFIVFPDLIILRLSSSHPVARSIIKEFQPVLVCTIELKLSSQLHGKRASDGNAILAREHQVSSILHNNVVSL